MPDPSQPHIGIEVLLNDADFQQKLRRFLRGVHQMEDIIDQLAQKSEQGDRRRARSAQSASDKITRAIRQLRWEMMAMLFFMRMARRTWDAIWTGMGEAAERGSERMGIRALARTMETDLGSTAMAIRELANEAMSVQDSFRVVLQGLLVDQGQFSDEYARLWEAARVAAVTGMTDAEDAFESFVTDLVDGTGAATDAISPIYQVRNALEEYAMATGRTVQMLSQQEAAHITLQQIYKTTNTLLDNGAREALEYAEAWEQVQGRLEELKDVFHVFVGDSGFLNLLNNLATSATKSLAILGSAIGAVRDTIRGGGTEFDTTVWGEIMAAARGDPSEAFARHMKRYAETLGLFQDEVDKSKIDYEQLRVEPTDPADLSPIVDHLLKRERLVEDHLYRVEQIEARHRARQAKIESRYNKTVAKAQRDAQRQRDRAMRNYNRQRRRQERQNLNRLAKLEEEYNLRLEQNRREFHLRDLQTQALYAYERSRLVAYGDVLGIEDLDARYALEKEAREQNFKEQQRQERENYELRLKWLQEAMALQMEALRQALDDQLEEIDIREEERMAEAAERRKEELAAAEEARAQQLEAEKRQHTRSLEQWDQYWIKLAEKFKMGLSDVQAILQHFFGAESGFSTLMENFLSQWERYISYLTQLQHLMGSIRRGASAPMPGLPPTAPVGSPSGRPYQYGGSGIFSRPSLIRVGEGHQPEMVNVRPIGSNVSMTLSWGGGAIPIQGSGLEGADLTGVGDTIAQGIVVALQQQIIRSGATYA